jgi:hypothetical protein
VIADISENLGLDAEDGFPRYSFSFEKAEQHCRMFLKLRLCKVSSVPEAAEWGHSRLIGAEKPG